jgi:siroheme synthase (precorrin-2 oxidase/ferrochelatase)
LILDLKFEGKYVIVVGGGKEGYRKTLSFLDAGAKILVISRSFSRGINRIGKILECQRITHLAL